MREIRQSGSEGGATDNRPYPYLSPGFSLGFARFNAAGLKDQENVRYCHPPKVRLQSGGKGAGL